MAIQYLTLANLGREGKVWSRMVPAAFRAVVNHALLTLSGRDQGSGLLNAAKVAIVAVDRAERRVIVNVNRAVRLDGSPFLLSAFENGFMRLPLEAGAPPSEWGSLDPLVGEPAGPRIKASLKGIGNPPLARERPRIGQARLPGVLGVRRGNGAHQTAPTPVDRFFWDASALSRETSPYDTGPGCANAGTGVGQLTPKQREALENSIGHRLSLIWGPPGTGKSLTCRALLAALAEWSVVHRRSVRVLVTGATWTAIDNVADRMPDTLRHMGSQADAKVYRLKSAWSEAEVTPALVPYLTPTSREDERFQELLEDLDAPNGLVLVASSCQQVAALVREAGDDPDKLRAELFDFVLIDEASQLNVAHTSMVFSSLAEGASVTVVGDDKQMPPIHPVPPPDGLEHVVGSIYDYYAHFSPEPIEPVMLDVNYRSNADILEFVQAAGYAEPITPFYPHQRLSITSRDPASGLPPDWPSSLVWNPEWEVLTDPAVRRHAKPLRWRHEEPSHPA